MSRVFAIIQIIISVLLVAAVMIQNKGVGLSQTFGGGGGGGGEGNTYSTKRGAEKTIFIVTVILAIIFLTLAVAHLFI